MAWVAAGDKRYGAWGFGFVLQLKAGYFHFNRVFFPARWGESEVMNRGRVAVCHAGLGGGCDMASAGGDAPEEGVGGEDADEVADGLVFARILVVDDDPISREIARLMLEKLGFQADVAADGRQGLQMAEAVSYDLIFMDCWMPGMSGVEVTRRLRGSANALSRRTQIVALTATMKPSESHECRDAGMDDFMIKPLRLECLVAKLTLHLPDWRPRIEN